ncbi:class I SAM-dependent methyltransferase [Paenibacillus guangzhouensis]|uniref:class I SAM-dependent methyltransferase n=1 Tax=Paenibacillus guangzhouensis TaxID=1473112 RepID=UPI001D11955A|nr:class I SAM-dependent methyltransferase [Paenibacillus guangzhouensis]
MTYEKALLYDQYRLPYSKEACTFIIHAANASQGNVADIGAGTGLLTRHFVGNVRKIYAIEPEQEMRRVACEMIGSRDDIEYIDGTAENTQLPDRSVDLIVVANAYHRFEPEHTIQEFKRIMRPGAMLAIFSYHDDTGFLSDTMEICREGAYRNRLSNTRHTKPVTYFYGEAAPSRYVFQQEHEESWEEYWGAVVSGMESPNESEAWFEEFKEAHHKRFRGLERNGVIKVNYSTEVWLGKPEYKDVRGQA